MKLDLFSVPIFIDDIDSSKININNINFEKTWNSQTISSFNYTNTIDEESAKYLLQTIANCISPSFGKSLRIEILNIWENIYEKDDFQEKHTHPQSHFSFVIYKKVEEGKTIFFNPALNIIESYYPTPYFFNATNFFQLEFIPKCKKNQIIIFPSFLEHMVQKINDSITISGNIIIRPNNIESKW